MRVWLACFLLLFALAEFFDWLKEFNLPLPIYILGGAFLAVASNYDKLVGSYLNKAVEPPMEVQIQQAQFDSTSQTAASMPFSVSHAMEQAASSELKE